uniref:Chlorophyll synthase n=1 Tax=Chromera velia CCMP2878 TaxID=1169474 RepID=A0A0G4H915_9ALVE|eukprot:Cvel_5892.t1-p1 / transcript=Cvel_5892.t1 / gene=Cvel_5892 / organism=Chromera_velia_CCMP2878 / gene_product=Chlorophyll synthase, chloroplastic, putative / transcript_product=Chlorophyll synthase, chloroplastic, putative / location=Cvel_scaffold281:33951-35207(-) / protein_length=419 / sequence_SO=supercontig / SO=protein_coding / is_pseudo=false
MLVATFLVSAVALASNVAAAFVAVSTSPSSRRTVRDASQGLPSLILRKTGNSSLPPAQEPVFRWSKSDSASDEKKKKNNNDVFDSDTRRLLGIKDASFSATDKWKIRLQLTKPITWVPLSLVVMCGAAASGNYHWIWNPLDVSDRNAALGLEDAVKGFLAVVLAGPFSEGFAQTINDWYDREIDAINEPHRPIPSGAISKEEVFQQLWALFLGGTLLAGALDWWSGHQQPTVLGIALLGYLVSYIYSAPPLKLKQNGWVGDLAIGLCYISLPWWCGFAVFRDSFDHPVAHFGVPVLLSLAGIGAGIVNDFKSMEGDKKFGLKSIPVLVGADAAKWIAAMVPDAAQLATAAYLASIGEQTYALVVLLAMVPQIFFQTTLLIPDPFGNDVRYMASSQPFLFLSVLATALCIGRHEWAAAQV